MEVSYFRGERHSKIKCPGILLEVLRYDDPCMLQGVIVKLNETMVHRKQA